MQQADTRFDLVAMLSAGAGAAEELEIALPQEFVGGNRGGMRAVVGHWSGRLGRFRRLHFGIAFKGTVAVAW